MIILWFSHASFDFYCIIFGDAVMTSAWCCNRILCWWEHWITRNFDNLNQSARRHGEDMDMKNFWICICTYFERPTSGSGFSQILFWWNFEMSNFLVVYQLFNSPIVKFLWKTLIENQMGRHIHLSPLRFDRSFKKNPNSISDINCFNFNRVGKLFNERTRAV